MRSATTADTSSTDPLVALLLDDQQPSAWPAAFAQLRSQAEAGAATDQVRVGLCLQFGRGTAPDLPAALTSYLLAADQGLAKAQFQLGECFSRGEGFPQDQAEAVRYYRLAADQGAAAGKGPGGRLGRGAATGLGRPISGGFSLLPLLFLYLHVARLVSLHPKPRRQLVLPPLM